MALSFGGIVSVTLLLSLLVARCSSGPLAQPHVTMTDIVDKTVANVETSLSIDDFVAAKSVREVDLVGMGLADNDATMTAGLFEGDIKAHSAASIHGFVESSNLAHLARNAILSSWRVWPSNEVPYTISAQYGSYSRSVIAAAIDQFHARTCIRFREATKADVDYVKIYPDNGCYSLVGRTGGVQPLSLDAGCIARGTIMHELMHTVGFFHEQSRTDRDDYVEIVYSEVEKGAEDQFEKYGINTITSLDEPYDYGSIMHYGPYAFSRYGWQTIVPLRDVTWANKVMGQRGDLSDTDVRKLNKLYDCPIVDDPATGGALVTTLTTTTAAPVLANGGCVDGDKCWLRKWIESCQTVAFQVECPVTCSACPSDVTSTTTTTRPTTSTSTMTTTTTTRRPTTTETTIRRPRPSGVCVDGNESCGRWAPYCRQSSYEDYMLSTCRRTCGVCTTTAVTPAPLTTCVDVESATTCRIGKILNYSCTAGFMATRCEKTCGCLKQRIDNFVNALDF